MAYNHILWTLEPSGIGLLTVNRQSKLNSLNAEVLREIDDVVRLCEKDSEVRALLVTGAGDKAFVAGADIAEIAAASPVDLAETSRCGQTVFRRIELMPKPSVAAINGFALGGGLEFAMACTLRVASENARLGMPEVKLGLIPGYAGTQRLPQLVGRGKAMEILLTGEPLDAREAQRIGLVNHVVPQTELLEFSRSLLRKILANGPFAVSLAMQAVDVGLSSGFEQGCRFETAAFGLTAASEDKQEGTQAFLEKRAPVFQGR